MSWIFYIIGAALVIAAVLVGRLGKRNSLRARDLSGNVVVGDVTGHVSQASSQSADAGKAAPDRVAWGIGIVGILVALAQLAHDVLK
jgi:hypothetical protein